MIVHFSEIPTDSWGLVVISIQDLQYIMGTVRVVHLQFKVSKGQGHMVDCEEQTSQHHLNQSHKAIHECVHLTTK